MIIIMIYNMILYNHDVMIAAGQMVMTDISESSGRADALGKLSLSYGVGMVFGPFLGGLITNYAG